MGVYDYRVKMPGGREEAMSEHAGKVLLIVNTASKCGFTPQYAGLEKLFKKYGDQGFEVLAFPCNQFGEQEPGDEEEIKNFCSLTYDVSFPLAAKIDVNGKDEDPLWHYLKQQQAGLMGSRGIKWNFTKFLIARDGRVTKRYAPATIPSDLEQDIKALL